VNDISVREWLLPLTRNRSIRIVYLFYIPGMINVQDSGMIG
jgi:hypothetical protein